MPNTIESSWGEHCQFFGSLRGDIVTIESLGKILSN